MSGSLPPDDGYLDVDTLLKRGYIVLLYLSAGDKYTAIAIQKHELPTLKLSSVKHQAIGPSPQMAVELLVDKMISELLG